MEIKSVFSEAFTPYGKVIDYIDVTELQKVMDGIPAPENDVVYVPGAEELESLDVFEQMRDQLFGGMPIQLGYCVGGNHLLNCFEYHRDSEMDYAATDLVLILGKQQDIDPVGFTYDTAKAEAFFLPKGTFVELYATTLHYAPSADTFRCAVALPKGTNTPLAFTPAAGGEPKLLTHTNKWLIAHADANEAKQGAHVGLVGENIRL